MTSSVAIVGNVNIDLIVRPVDAFPPPGTERLVDRIEMRIGGAAATTALALAKLGAPPYVASCVGDDEPGSWLRRELARHGILPELRTVEGWTSGISIAFEAPGHDRSFVTDLGSLRAFDATMVPEEALRSGLVLFCGYFLLPALRGAPATELMGRARAHGATVLLDTGWDPEGWTARTRGELTSILPFVDMFLPNEDEVRAIAGIEDTSAAAAALQTVSGGWVVVKRGSSGSIACGPQGRVLTGSAPASDVADTVGAGDAFNAGLLYASATGRDLDDAVRFAVRLASTMISRPSRDRFPGLDDIVG